MRKQGKRIFIIAIFCSLGFVAIFFRIIFVAFKDKAPSQKQKLKIVRGPILDRRGMTLAITEETSIIGIAPGEMIDNDFTARHLSKFLDLSVDALIKKFYLNAHKKYFFLKRQVDNYVADQILELNLPGVYREWEFKRIYPAQTLSSNLLGFVGRNNVMALAGLERIYNATLIKPENRNLSHGPSMYLTIDSLVQYRLEEVLSTAFVESKSKRAVGILMNIHSGAILAMASFPNFNPNKYYKSTPFQRANWPVRFNYEPGSTVKIFMAAILLAENVVNLQEKFYCDGTIMIRDLPISCKYRGRIHRHGHLTLPEIIQRSCNVGIIRAMQRVKKERLYYYLRELGFGQKTGIFPPKSGEKKGYFPDVINWVDSSTYYIPIGQSFTITPLQLLRAASSLAAGGRLVRPFVVKKFTSWEGPEFNHTEIETTNNPFAAPINKQVLQMMRLVVTRGTGRRANLTRISVAGKTGTAQKATARGYGNRYVASFIGFFPAEKPEFGMLILFDEPFGQYGGGSLAAPVFKKALRAILPALSRSVRTVQMDELKIKTVSLPAVNKKRLYNFRGLSAREALEIATGVYQLPVEFFGSGYVIRQSPPPGTIIKKIKRIRLHFQSH